MEIRRDLLGYRKDLDSIVRAEDEE